LLAVLMPVHRKTMPDPERTTGYTDTTRQRQGREHPLLGPGIMRGHGAPVHGGGDPARRPPPS